MRNYITRAVGTEEDIEIDLKKHDRKQGDRWLICSDGLYGMINRTQLLEIMKTDDLEQTADELMKAAMQGGGKDNISLILLQDDTVISETEEQQNLTEEKGTDTEASGEVDHQ
jgi:protein phosphatase